MASVAIHPPKTPVTKGSSTIATATIPNICKMPGPPAPFVPTPLPNIGQGSKSPQKDYSVNVKIEGHHVAIKGASFGSIGDIASKGTGGGIVSNNAEGQTSFIAPGSLTVKIEGKNVQLLGDQMLNNNGPSGSPPNAACMMGAMHGPAMVQEIFQDIVCACDAEVQPAPGDTCRSLGEAKHTCCNRKIHEHNAKGKQPKLGGEQGYDRKTGAPVSTPRMQIIGEPFLSFIKRISGKMFPDAAVMDAFGRPQQFVEFKFQCPAGVPTRKNAGPSLGTAPQSWTPGRGKKPGQLAKTIALGAKLDPPVTEEPMLRTNEKC